MAQPRPLLTAFLTAAIFAIAAPAVAQTQGRIGIGASFTHNATPDSDVSSATTYGPLVRLNPRKGWRVAGALNWFRADLTEPNGASDDFAELRTRPLMGGASYTIGSDTVLTSFSLVGGPSFNRAKFNDSHVVAAGESIVAKTSFAIRPGVGVTVTLAPRVALVGFGGYLFNRPDVIYRDRFGNEFEDRWDGDAVVLSLGVVYSVF
jgi:hypothetical protein